MNKKYLTSACALALAVTTLTGCGDSFNPDATLVKINTGDSTDTITLGYGNFVARYQQAMYDQFLMAYYGEDMWTTDMSGSGSTLQEDTKDGVLEDMEEMYVCKLHSDEYGVELTDDENTAIAEAVSSFMTDNPQETLDVMGATEEYVTQYLEYRTYLSKVQAAVEDDEAAKIADEDCWMRTFSYVLVDTTGYTDDDGNLVEYTDDELEQLLSDAEAIASSDDFDTAVESAGLSSSTYSYLKGEEEDDTFDMTVISAAEELEEGQISDVIEVEDVGYYVLRLDADHDEDASETERESLAADAYEDLVETWEAAITWDVDEDQWEKVQFDTLFTTLETEDDTDDSTTEDTESTDDTTDETSDTDSTDETVDDSTDTTESTEDVDTTSESTDTTDETSDTTDSTEEEAADEATSESDAE